MENKWNQINDDSDKLLNHSFDGAINWLKYTLIWLIEIQFLLSHLEKWQDFSHVK